MEGKKPCSSCKHFRNNSSLHVCWHPSMVETPVVTNSRVGTSTSRAEYKGQPCGHFGARFEPKKLTFLQQIKAFFKGKPQ